MSGWLKRRTAPSDALDLSRPWDLVYVPRIAHHDLAHGASAWSIANGGWGPQLAADPQGRVGQLLTSGFGGALAARTPRDGREVCVGVAALYLAPGSAAGGVHFAFSNSAWAGMASVGIDAAGIMTCVAQNEDYQAAAVVTVPGGDRRGRTVVVALSGGRESGESAISVRVACDGDYIGMHTGLGTTRINGSVLTVNPGNGWTGVTGTLLYAAYRYSTRHAMQDELVALSAGRGLLRPRERRLWLPGAAAPSTPTLLSASAINIGSTSFRPRVTFTR